MRQNRFLRYCLLSATDQLILMVQRRVVDLWRQAAAGVGDTVDWADMYQALLNELASLSAEGAVPDAELRVRLEALVTANRQRRPPSRASLVRERLIEAIRPVRSVLVAIAELPWQATDEHPVTTALATLRELYAGSLRKLPDDIVAPRLGSVWRDAISGYDRERAFRALEVATLFALRRSVRNGSVWIEHSLTFRGRERLFLPAERWQAEAKRHYARLSLPTKAAAFLEPLLARVRAGVDAVAEAARSGVLRVDDDLHLSALPADDEDPEVAKLRAKLDHRIGEVQLPEVILAVDAQVRFSWIMLGREPRSAARGDPIHEAGVQLGRLLRTAFLADYFVNVAFRRELRRVLNRGEAVNALKRAIYTGRVSPAQAKRVDEMQAVADALSLLANIVMAWNTAQMRAVLDRWANRRQVIPPELIGRIAPTRLEGINLRGVFRFPIERYAEQLLPSQIAAKTNALH